MSLSIVTLSKYCENIDDRIVDLYDKKFKEFIENKENRIHELGNDKSKIDFFLKNTPSEIVYKTLARRYAVDTVIKKVEKIIDYIKIELQKEITNKLQKEEKLNYLFQIKNNIDYIIVNIKYLRSQYTIVNHEFLNEFYNCYYKKLPVNFIQLNALEQYKYYDNIEKNIDLEQLEIICKNLSEIEDKEITGFPLYILKDVIYKLRNYLIENYRYLFELEYDIIEIDDADNSGKNFDLVKKQENEIETFTANELKKPAKTKGRPPQVVPENLTLKDKFEKSDKYQYVINLLCGKEKKISKIQYIDEKTHFWIDKKKASKIVIISLLKHLHTLKYYKKNTELSANEIMTIALNTFGVKISIPHIRNTAVNDIFMFIPNATEVTF